MRCCYSLVSFVALFSFTILPQSVLCAQGLESEERGGVIDASTGTVWPVRPLEELLTKSALDTVQKSLPAVHELLISNEWNSLHPYEKFRLVSPQLRKKWNNDNPFGAVDIIDAFKTSRSTLEGDASTMNSILASGVNHLIRHFARISFLEEVLQTDLALVNEENSGFSSENAANYMRCRSSAQRGQRDCSPACEIDFLETLTECLELKNNPRVPDQLHELCFPMALVDLIKSLSKCELDMMSEMSECMTELLDTVDSNSDSISTKEKKPDN